MNKSQIQAALYKMGFDNAYKAYSTAVRGFQFGWALGDKLSVDGIAGPLTQSAIKKSLARLNARRGTMSNNFSFTEFRCKCGGRYSTCKRMWTHRSHVLRLEKYRAKVGKPVRIISGYRCPSHNRAVGGASKSQHMYGYSSDFVGLVNSNTLASWRIFAGIGKGGQTGRAVHGDSRDLSPYNYTGGTTSRPTRWTYSWG